MVVTTHPRHELSHIIVVYVKHRFFQCDFVVKYNKNISIWTLKTIKQEAVDLDAVTQFCYN